MREVRLQELKELLVGRGYKRGVVDEAVQYGLALDRTEALKKVSREEASQKRVRYNIIFDPKLPKFPPILVKNWKEMVNSDQRLKSPFPAPPMASLKRSPNLADELIRAKLTVSMGQHNTRGALGHTDVGFRICRAGKRRCSLCPFAGVASDGKTVVKEVTILHSGEVVRIQENITCKDPFCLYVLTCLKPGCELQYAGLSSRPVYQRFSEHLASITDPNTTTEVGLHWQQSPGHKVEHLQFIPVERLRGSRDPATLRQRERDFINRYEFVEKGLNNNL